MSDARSELSSIATSLESITERIAGIAERESSGGGDTDLATELFEVERALTAGYRRLNRSITR